MTFRLVTFLCVLWLFASCNQQNANNTQQELKEEFKSIGVIQRIDPKMDDIIQPGTQIEVIAEGFEWTEGPIWIEDGEYLLFSDIPKNSIYKWKEGEGQSLYLNPSGYTGIVERGGEPGSNGLLLDKEGKLILCQHGDRRMAKMESPLNNPKPEFVTLADRYKNMRFNSPNDAVFHSNGDLYFTDPPYGLDKNMDDPQKEIPFQGVYRLKPNGQVDLLTDQITRPNGICFSVDESQLFVACSDPKAPYIYIFNVLEDGSIDKGKVWADTKSLMGEGIKGLPDGMKMRSDGILFATGPGGVLIFDQDAKHIGTISSGEATSNIALDEKGKMLYATSDMYLIRVPLQ